MPKGHKHAPVLGEIYPGGLLTAQGVKRKTGIGREKLAECRRAGKIKPYYFGGTGFYRSDDIIALIVSSDERTTD